MEDPYHDFKKIHKAHQMDRRGRVSPLCADAPRPLRLHRESWCLRDEDVTCADCLAKLGIPDPKAEARRREQSRIAAIVGDCYAGS